MLISFCHCFLPCPSSGHGRRFHFTSHEEQQAMLQEVVEAEEGY